jgi:hypothetical protein
MAIGACEQAAEGQRLEEVAGWNYCNTKCLGVAPFEGGGVSGGDWGCDLG